MKYQRLTENKQQEFRGSDCDKDELIGKTEEKVRNVEKKKKLKGK